MKKVVLKPAIGGIAVGLAAALVWHSYSIREPELPGDPAPPETLGSAESIRDKDIGQDWLTDKTPLPPPFSPPSRLSRSSLPPQERAAIIFDIQELLGADDYLEVLESLARDAPDLLFEQARSAQSLPALVAMRCYFANVENLSQAVDQLKLLRGDPAWANRLSKLVEEIWHRPDVEKSDEFLSILGDLRSSGEDKGNRFGILLRKRSEDDFSSALDFLEKHPEYASDSGIVDQVWAKDNSADAFDYLSETVESGNGVGHTLRLIGIGIIESGDVQLINQTLDLLAAQAGMPGIANLYAELARKSIGLGEPSDWFNRVASMPPGVQKDQLVLDLANRLKVADMAPSDWGDWLEELGMNQSGELAERISRSAVRE